MAIFEEVRLEFQGKQFVIAPARRMEAIAIAEDILTLSEIAKFQERQSLPLSKLAQAYGALLRFAGCDAANEEVYAEMFRGNGKKMVQAAWGAVIVLQKLMIPPADLIDKAKKSEGRARKPAAR